MASEITIVNATTVAPDALCDAHNAAFANYVVPFPKLDVESWRAVLRRQGVDLSLSLAALRGDMVMAYALVTPRGGGITRIATMGARPEARGSGIAATLLDHILHAARDRGAHTAELEVFAQNERAFRLYRSRGFTPAASLFGYEDALGHGKDADALEVTREDGVAWADAFERDERDPLPWQVTGAAVAHAPANTCVWRLGAAQLAFVHVGGAVTVMSVLDRTNDQSDAARLLAVLRHRFPGSTLRAPQLQRERGPAEAFERAGWARSALFQYLMRRPL